MKRIKGRYDLVFFFFFPFFILGSVLYFVAFNQFIGIASTNWIFTLVLILCVFSPQSKIVLGDTHNKIDLKWLAMLLVNLLLLNIGTWSFAKIISVNLITTGSPQLDIMHLSMLFAFYPWGLMTLLAITLAYFCYHKKKLGLLSSAFTPLFKNTHDDSIGIAVDSYMRFIPFFMIIFILGMLTLCLLLLQKEVWHPFATGLNLPLFFISSLLFLGAVHPVFIKFIHRLSYHRVPVVVILLFFVLVVSVIYTLLTIVIRYFNPAPESMILTWYPSNDFHHITILTTIWWYGLSVLTSGVMAYQARNKSIRAVIVTSLFAFLLSLGSVFLLELIYVKLNSILLPIFTFMFFGVVVLMFIFKKTNLTYFLRATLPTDSPIKIRSTFRFLKIVPLAIVCFITVYLGIGVFAWSYLAVVGFLPSFIIITMSYLAWLKEVYRS